MEFKVVTLFCFLFATCAFATTYNVSTLADLQAKINIAVAGDTIIVANGVYTASASITVGRDGSAANPIVIKAASIGGVEITGSSGFSFSGASFVTIQGFKFTHASSLGLGTSNNHIRITRCIIELGIPSGSDVSYITISGDDMEIDHCELRNKSTLGEMLDISGSGSQVARRLWVHHNYFHDFTSPGGNGAETIRWGLSGLSLSTGNGMCEYNLFDHCDGENELISNKSSGNTYRYNTFLNSAGDQMSQRHGNNCVYYGNYFRGTDGLRYYGDNHQIYANYFENNSSGIDTGNGDGDVQNGAPLTSHDRPDNVIVAYNTFITNSTNYRMEGRTGGLGASNIMVFNNVFQGGGNAGSISSSAPYIGTWGGNIVWQVSSTGNMPSGTFTAVNPLLAKDANGVFHIQSGSPAINANSASQFPFVRDEMDGQPRDANPDTGADEFSSAPVLAKLLTTADVGINAAEVPYVMSWEAEGLTPSASGATTAMNSDQNASGWAWFALNADAAGDFVEFTLPRVPAGTYSVRMSYKQHPNRGTLQLSVDGSNVGGTLNEYSSTVAYLEQTFGTVTFSTTGPHTIRLTCTGKDAAAGAFTLSADRITLAPSAANNPPTVSLTAPANGAVFPLGQNISVSANASDSDGSVTLVEFFDGANLIGSDSTSPYSITWSGASAGGHTITARATDNNGAQTTSSAVSITVNQSPTVSLTAPANGATFQLGQNITVSANASDADGSVASVQFFDGASSIGTDTSSPYSITWSGASAGSHTITARATDNNGAQTSSSAVSITVNQPPTVSITAPANGAAFNQGSPITITASPADPDGSVTLVEFFDGATPLGQATASPWSFTWNNAALGSHSLTARATDDDGAQTTSAAVGITVNSTNTGPVVLYRETFGAPNGADIASMALDWQCFESNGVARTAANINCTNTSPGWPANVANTASAGPNSDGSTSALSTGWLYLQPAQRLAFTPEFSVNPASYATLKFSWYQLNANSSRTTRLAIRIGSQWYASATALTGGVGGLTDWANSNQLQEVIFNPTAANWVTVNFNGNYVMGPSPGTGTASNSTLGNITLGSAPGANLSGTITAFGVYHDGVGSGNSRFDSFTVTGDSGTLPSPWQDADIGAVASAGSASAAAGVFTITGSGTDIWTTADEFHFVYQAASGDCDIRARVVTQQNTHVWAKSGVMIRETLNAGSIHAMTAVTPGSGVTFVRRTATGAASSSTTTAGVAAPQWVRINRTGTTFTSSYSPDGSNWTTLGSTNITMGTSVFIGLPVCSHADGTNCTSTFDNMTPVP